MKKKPETSAARMKRLGYKGITIYVTPEQKADIEAGAKADNRPVSQFIITAAIKAAKKITRKP